MTYLVYDCGDEVHRHAAQCGDALDPATLGRHRSDAIDDVAEAVQPDATLERDGVGQCLEADAAMPAETAGELHLHIGSADEVENPSSRQLESALTEVLPIAIGLSGSMVLSVDRFDLACQIGEYGR